MTLIPDLRRVNMTLISDLRRVTMTQISDLRRVTVTLFSDLWRVTMTLISDLWRVTMTLISTCLSQSSIQSWSDWTLFTETLAPGFLDISVGNFQMKILNWMPILFCLACCLADSIVRTQQTFQIQNWYLKYLTPCHSVYTVRT